MRAVLASSPSDAIDPTGGEDVVRHDGGIGRQILRVEHELADLSSDRLVGRVAEEIGGGRIPAGDHLVAIHRHDRHGADVDERLEVLLLAVELGRSFVLGRDVDHEALDVGCLARLVADDPRVVANPDETAVLGEYAVLLRPTLDALLERLARSPSTRSRSSGWSTEAKNGSSIHASAG